MLKKLWTTRPYALEVGLFILRVGTAFFLARHGWGKFTSYSKNAATFPDPLHVTPQISLLLTIFAELFCSGFLLIGLFTRIVLIPLIITMVILVTLVHGKDPLSDKEHAFLFLLPFLCLFLAGPGSFSLDRMLKR